MGAGERILKIIIGGDAKGAQKALDDTAKSAEGTGSKLGGLASTGALAFGAIGAAAVGFAAKSADTFARVGGEVLKLQRYTGATAEDASRLRFAGTQAGLGVDVMTKSLGLLSKGLATTKFDKLGLDLKDAHGHAKPLNDDLLNIANRFQGMSNGPEKTALAMKLFGKAGADMIPFLNRGAAGIRELEKESDKLGNTLSTKDLKAVKESTANHRLFSAAMDGLQIQVGRYVLPIITKFTTFLATNMPAAIATVRAVMLKLAPVFTQVGNILATSFKVGAQFIAGTLVPGLVMLGTWVVQHQPILIGLAVAVGVGLVSAFVSWAVAAGAAAIATIAAAAPVILLGAAIAALVAGIVWAYQNWGFFSTAVGVVGSVLGGVIPAFQAVWGVMQGVFGWVQSNWPLLLAILTGPIGLAVLTISRNWDTIQAGVVAVKDFIVGTWDAVIGFFSGLPGRIAGIASGLWSSVTSGVTSMKTWVGDRISDVVGFVTGLPGRIRSAASGMWNGISDAFKSAMNFIIRGWNGLHFHIPGFHVGLIGYDGFDLGVPHIKELAEGGIIRAQLGGMLARLGEGGSNEAVIPLSPSGLRPMVDAFIDRLRTAGPMAVGNSGSTVIVQVDATGANFIDPSAMRTFVNLLRTELDQITRRNGF